MNAAKSIQRPKLRIIFRGLILFRFERSTESEELGVRYDGEGCQLRALLINKPDSKGVHEHVPKIGIIGRDTTTGEELLGHRKQLRRRETVQFSVTQPKGEPPGVAKDQSFEAFVPMLSEVYGGMPEPGRRDNAFVAAQVIVPAGRIRAKSLISWTHDFLGPDKNSGAERPVNVEFFWNRAWLARPAASECVLEVPLAEGSLVKLLGREIEPLFNKEANELADDEKDWGAAIEPNTVDVIVTNFGAQRPIPVPWSVHYQMLFHAAGYGRRPFEPQAYARFVAAAGKFAEDSSDKRAWRRDQDHVAQGQGFPIPHVAGFLSDMPGSRLDVADAIEARSTPGMDPLNRPICPPAVDG